MSRTYPRFFEWNEFCPKFVLVDQTKHIIREGEVDGMPESLLKARAGRAQGILVLAAESASSFDRIMVPDQAASLLALPAHPSSAHLEVLGKRELPREKSRWPFGAFDFGLDLVELCHVRVM
jgi:hypothetical protein